MKKGSKTLAARKMADAKDLDSQLNGAATDAK